MGRYQWGLFVLCGMGWVADNLWLQVHQKPFLYFFLGHPGLIYIGCCPHFDSRREGVRCLRQLLSFRYMLSLRWSDCWCLFLGYCL